MPYGICKVCGCTDDNPCYHPEHGFCWWVDDTHELCSHCADKSIAEDPDNPHHIIPQWQLDMARWVNKHQLFQMTDFAEFEPRKGFKCIEYLRKYL